MFPDKESTGPLLAELFSEYGTETDFFSEWKEEPESGESWEEYIREEK